MQPEVRVQVVGVFFFLAALLHIRDGVAVYCEYWYKFNFQ